jgi:hypothetical protein
MFGVFGDNIAKFNRLHSNYENIAALEAKCLHFPTAWLAGELKMV